MSSSVPDPADLTAFLKACLDEDERLATEALGLEVSIDVDWGSHAVLHHIHRWSSARVLAEVAAKRRLLELHRLGDDPWSTTCETCMDLEPAAAGDMGGQQWPCETVRLLAAPFRGAPGWRNEWAIED